MNAIRLLQAREQGVEPWLDKNNSAVGKGGTGPSATADEGTTAKAPAAAESQDDASAALPVK